MTYEQAIDRGLHKFRKNRRVDEDGCWIWTGARRGPYGRVTIAGKRHSVHRMSWDIFRGPLLDGHVIHHLCEKRLCYNPDHLKQMSRGDHTTLHKPATILY